MDERSTVDNLPIIAPDDYMEIPVVDLASKLNIRRSRLKKFQDLSAPKVVISNEKRMLEAVEIAWKARWSEIVQHFMLDLKRSGMWPEE